jgi:hypothetical protein
MRFYPREVTRVLRVIPGFLCVRKFVSFMRVPVLTPQVFRMQWRIFCLMRVIIRFFGRPGFPQWLTLQMPWTFIANCRLFHRRILLVISSRLYQNISIVVILIRLPRGARWRRPTPLILSNASYGTEWRHIHYIWSIIGYQRRKHLKLTITGRRLPGDKYLYYNPLYNEIVVDFFRVTVKNFPEFLAQLSKYPIDYLETYPSLLRELRGYLEHFGLSIKIKGIMLGSEGIDQRERRAAEIFFDARS